MVPDKFNMVDMGGIDLIMMQGEAVPGLYEKLMAAISNCRYQCLYNWMFNGVLIPPTYVQIEADDDEVFLNEGVSVTSDDVIHIYSVEPGPVDPEIIPLLAEENGVYNAPTGKDGFNPVTVDVPSYTPVINSITITENGNYSAPSGVDGFSPVIVNVPSGGVSEKIMNQGQVSTTSAYATAYFDPSVDLSQYDMLGFVMFRGGADVGEALFSTPSSYPKTFSIAAGGYVYNMSLSQNSISCTQYSGSYVNLYVDVYGFNLS